MASSDLVLTTVIVGHQGSGSTSLVRRFVNHQFSSNSHQTVGVDFYSRQIIISEHLVSLSIWDVSSNSEFKHLRKQFFTGVFGAVLTIDTNNDLANLKVDTEEYIDEIMSKTQNCVFILAGTKKDSSRKIISEEQGIEFANELSKSYQTSVKYIECSALTGENVELVFSTLVRLMCDYLEPEGYL
ncbi:MAG: GTP-binding protein [Candidatus Heimdallarchaeota archaeon]|nr:GTP-binding protein [Candidatus Heimdallarchaeota archaeon]